MVFPKPDIGKNVSLVLSLIFSDISPPLNISENVLSIIYNIFCHSHKFSENVHLVLTFFIFFLDSTNISGNIHLFRSVVYSFIFPSPNISENIPLVLNIIHIYISPSPNMSDNVHLVLNIVYSFIFPHLISLRMFILSSA